MNNFEEGNIITLNDDNDYIIVNVIEFKENKYLNLLLNDADEPKMKIVKIVNNYGMILLTEELTEEEVNGVLDIIKNQ